MRRHARSVALVPPLLMLLLVAAPAHAAWPTSPYTNLPICTAAGQQLLPYVIPDGTGGFYIGWDDLRSGELRPYLQRVLADGSIAPGWPVDGLRIANSGVSRFGQMVLGPGGSAIVAFTDARADAATFDVYAIRIEPNATFGVGWPVDGRQLANVAGKSEAGIAIATDGVGGAYVAWRLDYSPTDHDIYVSHVLANGLVGAGISPGGDPICTLTSEQFDPAIAADGLGNAIIAWEDKRSLGNTVFDIYGQKQLANGTQAWTAMGIPLSDVGAGSNAADPCVLPDGAGGAVVGFWIDGSPTSFVIGTQRVNAAGLVQWGTAGIAVATSATAMAHVDLVTDGAGGWIVAWEDYRDGVFTPALYAARVLSSGSPTWNTNGVRVIASGGFATFPLLVSDGAGGALVFWTGAISPNTAYNIRGQRLGPGGQRMWGADGVALSFASLSQASPMPCGDGAGGACVVWMDDRSQTTSPDIYAQRVDRFGALGDATPKISKIADVPNDQGGEVSLQWTASVLDALPDRVVRTYSLWRRVPGGTPPALRAGRARVLADDEPAPGTGAAFRTTVEGGQVVYWEYLTSKPAAALPGYSAVVATTSDSLPGSNPRTSYFVRAETLDGAMYWDSAPDSGYSVDNVAPATPAPFTGLYSNGRSLLTWGANGEPDLSGYRVHRGTDPGFAPSDLNLVAQVTGPSLLDPAGTPYWYKLAAVDVHGNLSGYALVLPAGALDAPGGRLPAAFALRPIAPNPARGATDLAFALPRAAAVTIALYDASGRRVRTLVAGEHEAGEHAVRWDGRDESGTVAAAGLYFVRMQAGAFRAERRLVRLP